MVSLSNHHSGRTGGTKKFLKTKKIPFDIFDTNIVEAEKTKEERKSWNEKKWKRHLRSK